MQNLDKKASILLWSIFLSLMISSIFITLSLQIHTAISENKKIETRIKNQKTITNMLATQKKDIIELDKETTLILEPKNTFFTSLEKHKTLKFTISADTNITITPKTNTLLNVDIGDKELLVSNESTFAVKKDDMLIISNMGGFAQFKIYTEKEINFPYRKYKVKQKIGNTQKTIENGKVQ